MLHSSISYRTIFDDKSDVPISIGFVDQTGEIVLSPYQLILLLSAVGMGENTLQNNIRRAIQDATPIGTLRTVAIYRLGHSTHDFLRALIPLIPKLAARVDWSAPQ